MKKVNIIYWIFTGLLVLLMATSAIGSFIPNPQGAATMQQIGIGPHLIPFLAVAKILGITALLVPGFPRIREWAYAGFTFDVAGALYLFIAAGEPPVQWIGMIIGLVLIAGSYIYWHKKLKLQAVQA
jgi:hypothetical protein